MDGLPLFSFSPAFAIAMSLEANNNKISSRLVSIRPGVFLGATLVFGQNLTEQKVFGKYVCGRAQKVVY